MDQIEGILKDYGQGCLGYTMAFAEREWSWQEWRVCARVCVCACQGAFYEEKTGSNPTETEASRQQAADVLVDQKGSTTRLP